MRFSAVIVALSLFVAVFAAPVPAPRHSLCPNPSSIRQSQSSLGKQLQKLAQ